VNYQLTLTHLLERAEKLFPNKEIVSRTSTGIFRYTYAEYGRRTRALASALQALGVQRGDRVGTFAWNQHRHLETYFAVPCIGAVLHTVNIRLSDDHIVYIINHAEDQVLFVDADLVPTIERVRDQLKTVKAYVIMADRDTPVSTTLSPVYQYEELLDRGNPEFAFPDDIDENSPMGMCYSSATTGNPKGVVYTHRSTYLHSMCLGLRDSLAISENDCSMPIVPMFHVNAWGLPFAAVWFGAKQVLPGAAPTPRVLLQLIQDEKVTFTAGVPTVWMGVLKEMEESNYDVSSLRGVLSGGAAAPRSLIEAYEIKFGIPFIHGYGMTEASPVIAVSRIKSNQQNLSTEEIIQCRSKQGLPVPGIDVKIIGKNGQEAKWDGLEMGELLLRGPWVVNQYYNDERTRDAFRDGWYHSGDVAVIDEEGFVKVMDRTKDLVKSGGEWISSLDLENALMGHPAVFEACVVGVPHPKWDERPLAFVVPKEGFKGKLQKQEFVDYLMERFAKWWVPDDVIFIDEIPKSSVGKFLKRTLRDQYHNYFVS
jgi:fatty-acyl-CoA synthase